MIKIISGVYGYRDENGNIKPKTPKDAPFSLTEGEEKRLVRRGVATYITDKAFDGVATSTGEENGNEKGNTSPGEENSSTGEKELRTKPDYDMETGFDDLKDLLKEIGLAYKVGMSKTDIVAALDEYYDDTDGDDDEAPPAPEAEEPVE